MDKYNIFIQQKYEWFKDAIVLCSNIFFYSSPKKEWIVFEELNIDIPCYLCDKNLDDFFNNYMIDNEIKDLSIKLRESFINLQKGAKWNTKAIWHSIELQEVIKISKDILKRLYY